MSRRLELGLALALALAVAVAFVAGSRGASAPPLDFRTSSLVSGPQGSRAVYDVLARLRVPVERRRAALFDFARDTAHRAPPAGQLEEGECETVPAPAEDTLLHLTDGRPAVLRLHYQGGGSVTLVADPGYFRNRVWRSTDVPYFVAPLLMPARRGSVVWDEYHQGFGRGRSMAAVLLGWLAGTPGGWAILQLVAVLLAGLAVTAVRFGPPRRGVATRRLSPPRPLEAS